MRNIKFRAFDLKTKEIKQVDNIYFYNKEDEEGNLGEASLVGEKITKYFGNGSLKQVKLMQYTGLKDKNGKEIYEGDIIEGCKVYSEMYENSDMYGIGSGYGEELYIDGIKGEIKFIDGNFVLENKKCILHKTKKYQTFNLGNWKDENVEELWRVENWNTYNYMIEENGGKEKVLKMISEITIIGNIYENPDLLNN